jgi:NADPH2:quinone reductase
VAPEEWLLVLGAAGGVGLATIDVARTLGMKVIAAASTDDKLQLCIERGAHGVVDYSTEELTPRVRELTDGGADVAVDPVGGDLAESALRALGNGGRLLVVGFASGTIPELPANQILLRNRSVLGVDWGAWAMSDPEGNARVMAEVLSLADKGALSPAEPVSYPLADAGTALRDLLERRVTGKLCLTP